MPNSKISLIGSVRFMRDASSNFSLRVSFTAITFNRNKNYVYYCSQPKCIQYWPNKGQSEAFYCEISVQLMEEEQLSDWTIRTFYVKKVCDI